MNDPPSGDAADVLRMLQRSEERFQLATEALAGFLYDYDVETKRTARFGGTREVLGFGLDEVSPDPEWWQSRVHPDDLAAAHELGRGALGGTAAYFTNEYRFLHKDGHYVHVSDRCRIIRDASGHPVRVLGGVTDVSERRQLEQAREKLLTDVQWERSRLEEIFDASPAFIALTRGPDHVFEYVNEAYYRLFGRRDLIGRRAFDVFPEARDQGFPAIRERVLADGVPFVGREMLYGVDSLEDHTRQDRFLDVTYLPYTEPDGTRSGIILHGVDITAHVLARRAAEAATRQRDHVLDVVAHELGSPLSTIGICARTLADSSTALGETAATIDLIERCVASMHRLIRDLSDVASIETGRLALDLHAAQPIVLLASAAEHFAGLALDAGISLTTHAPPDLPDVVADPGRVVQALSNLLTNALRHTKRGGRVTLHAERESASVRFAVDDDGDGIAAEDLPHVFDRFWHKRPAAHRGDGLGLPIVRGIVDAHGGTVDVASEIGKGTRSSFTLPLAR
ncbi:MAG: rpfC [Gemmatimonadetes bacterium]|nr:rpfC [Gemmatimonadota bacterium]